MIRPGSSEALIELLFYTEDEEILNDLKQRDLPAEDGMILVRRVISEKRNVKRINDCTVTLKTAGGLRKAHEPSWTAGTPVTFK